MTRLFAKIKKIHTNEKKKLYLDYYYLLSSIAKLSVFCKASVFITSVE